MIRRRIKQTVGAALLLLIVAIMAVAQRTRVAGVVRDQAGATVAGAQVTLRREAQRDAETTTDEAGRFEFANVTAGTGFILVRARGFAPVEQRWRADTNTTAQIEITVAPAPLAETVAVTAARVATRLNDTAASVALLTRTDLAATAAVTLDDALRQVAGFQLFRRAGSRTANPTTQGVSLRGVGASGASRALVLADGVPLNDPFGGWVYWGRVPREEIGRVEVLRGGASALYGGGALGGVVNVITRHPDAPALALELSYGNQQTPAGSFFAGTKRGPWAASLGAEVFHTDGYVLLDDRARGRVDTRAGARHTTLDVTAERQLGAHARAFIRGSLFGEARTNGTPLQTNRTHIRTLHAGGDWAGQTFGTLTVRAYAGAQLFDQNFSAVAADRNTETLTRVQRVPAQVLGVSAQWARALGTRQTVVAGFDAREVRGASDETVYAQGRATSLVGAGGRERTAAVFFEDIVRASARLNLVGGLRIDHWRNYAAASTARPLRPNALTAVTPFPARAETAFSPQLSALYKAGAHVSLAAAGYRAFRQPTLNELYRTFRVGDVQTLANERLRAERLTGGEAGAIINALGARLNVRGTFYWTEITRPVANVTLSSTPTLITRQRQNLGRTRARAGA